MTSRKRRRIDEVESADAAAGKVDAAAARKATEAEDAALRAVFMNVTDSKRQPKVLVPVPVRLSTCPSL
jgi:hypothetical protein